MNFKRILVLAPHTDDEIACAGAVSKFVDQGSNVWLSVFSWCEQSVPKEFDKDILKKECKKSAEILGLRNFGVDILNYRVRNFLPDRQNILEYMVEVNKAFIPDLVFMPASTDVHQDHQVIHNEGLRAFKQTNILGYEMPSNNVNFNGNTFIKLNNSNIETKIKARGCYKSQAFRGYMNPELFIGLAKIRGVQCNAEYAEAFEHIRGVIC